MGYRSDVHILFYSNKELMDAFIVRCKMEGHYRLFTEGNGLDLEEKWIKVYRKPYRAWEFREESIKWYDSFSFVTAMQHMLDLADEMGVMWESVRVGEDHNDIVISSGDGDNECILGVRREITTDYSEVDGPITEDKADEETQLSALE